MRATVVACVTAAAFLVSGLQAFPQTPPAQTPDELPPLPDGGGGRLEQLENELCEIDAEAQAIGGGRTIKESLDNVGTRDNEVKDQIRRVNEAIERLGGTQEELKAAAEQLGDVPIFTLSEDGPQEGREQAGEKAGKAVLERFGKKGLSRFLGWAALVGDIVEYGGKIVIRKLNVSDMEALVRQQRLTLNDVYDLAIHLRQEETALREKKKSLEALRARSNATWQALAEERGRWKDQQRPPKRACGDAELHPDHDTAGDRQLLREHQKEQKKKAKVTVAAVGAGVVGVGALVLARGNGGSAQGPTPQPSTAPGPGSSAPPAAPGPSAFGFYGVNLVCIDNPRNHHEFVRADQVSQLEVTGVATMMSAGAATVMFSGPAPWVGVGGEWDPATGRFSATGRGRVAGNANIRCDFNGTLTPAGELEGDYVMGVGGGLPGGGTVTYRVTGRKN